jgi:hypothetical protein
MIDPMKKNNLGVVVQGYTSYAWSIAYVRGKSGQKVGDSVKKNLKPKEQEAWLKWYNACLITVRFWVQTPYHQKVETILNYFDEINNDDFSTHPITIIIVLKYHSNSVKHLYSRSICITGIIKCCISRFSPFLAKPKTQLWNIYQTTVYI